MSDDYGYLLDMVQRKSCVDAALKVWKEKRETEWKMQDDNWEKKYDYRIAEEERKEKEEEERYNNLTQEERDAEQAKFESIHDFFTIDSDSDSDSDSDEDDSDIEIEDDDLPCWEDDSNLTPEEKKAKEWESYKTQVKEWRKKRTMEVWDQMLNCSWRQLRAYRTQLGMSNENFNADTFL